MASKCKEWAQDKDQFGDKWWNCKKWDPEKPLTERYKNPIPAFVEFRDAYGFTNLKAKNAILHGNPEGTKNIPNSAYTKKWEEIQKKYIKIPR